MKIMLHQKYLQVSKESVKYIHDDTMTYLPLAEREIECELRHLVSKPVVSPVHLDRVAKVPKVNTNDQYHWVMPELPRDYKKFDLSYLDNVVVFSEGWNFSIDHMDGILEGNTRSAVRPAECELAQNGVEYRGYVVGLGKQSPAQLKFMPRILSRKEEFVANAVPAPVDDVGDQKRMVLRP
ncbi:UNVERIFIED_CONTAM: hypothetical protein NCL1_50461 [Trichonephila clavipes]